MVTIDFELCNGCSLCASECPLACIKILDKKASIGDGC